MLYLYKILRITAWLLVLATILSLFTGYLTIKYFLLTGIDYRSIHINLIPWFFIPLFYIHSAIGFINLLSRHKSTNKKSVKIIFQILWLAIFVLLILVILAKPPAITPINNNSFNNSSNSQSIVLTIAEISKHNLSSDCWLIISNKVYNVTTYLGAHPGGYSMILPYCGQDGTRAFATKDIGSSHSGSANAILANFYIGDVGSTTNTQNLQNQPTIPNSNFNNNESEIDE